MMNGKQHPDSLEFLDWMSLFGFLGSVLLGTALPFFLGVFAVHRLFPFAELNSWVYGWRAVTGILGIFLVWFFSTYITDRLAKLFSDKRTHPVLHEFVGEALSVLVLFVLMYSLFAAWQAALLCSVVTSILTVVFGLIINNIFDHTDRQEESKDHTI
ncbi:hypothetical protein [Bifidobacterium crudilactis]|jgi:uncharacterized membrane protein|uniref:hypothetical protein n=1 Tax=Bifidobacterium crudilactis TaxID=327277 RepID=UPI003A5C032B